MYSYVVRGYNNQGIEYTKETRCKVQVVTCGIITSKMQMKYLRLCFKVKMQLRVRYLQLKMQQTRY